MAAMRVTPALGALGLMGVMGFAACSATQGSGASGFGGAGGGTSSSGNSSGMGGDTTSLVGGAGGGGCVGLGCMQMPCGGGSTTAISGVVVAPTPPQYGKADPLYNALVYVPNGAVDPFTPGVSCDKCGTPASGSPLVIALTDASGKFLLTNAPVGKNIPLVIQLGRWRRQVVIPEVKACTNNQLTTDLTRLPRNKGEGDIPHIAIASSTFDSEECILRKIGVDDAEFTDPAGNGRIHIYEGNGSKLPNSPPMDQLWADLNTLKQYDMVLFPCSSVAQMGDPGFQNVFDYANLGGRVFATDLSYPWFKNGPGFWPTTAKWVQWGGLGIDPLPAFIDTSFPKGQAMAQWLQNIGATQMLGQIGLHETYHVVDAVNPPTTRWLYSQSPVTVQTLSFNTPVGAMPMDQCGRAVYSNFHIANNIAPGGSIYPSECDNNPLTPQEKVLEFLLFDLASCVQDDTKPPMVPK